MLGAGAVLAEAAIYALGVPWLAFAYLGGNFSRAAAVGLLPLPSRRSPQGRGGDRGYPHRRRAGSAAGSPSRSGDMLPADVSARAGKGDGPGFERIRGVDTRSGPGAH